MYSLLPPQYAKIKIANWTYTYDEVVTIVGLARKAFDELGLPPDAEERTELDAKEKEALATAPRERSPPEMMLPPKIVSPPKPAAVSPTKPVKALTPSLPPSRAESPALGPTTSKKTAAKDKAGRTKIGKQIAKMRSEHAKRASSLPNPKGGDGTASPRLGPTSPEDVSPPGKKEPSPPTKKEPSPPTKKELSPVKASKLDKDKAVKTSPRDDKKPLAKAERKTSGDKKKPRRDYTSSEDSDSDDGRGRARNIKPTTNGKKAAVANGSAKRRPSPSYTSSDEDKPKRKRLEKDRRREDDGPNRTLPSFKRRQPTPLDLDRGDSRDGKSAKSTNGHGALASPAHLSDQPRTPVTAHPDAKALRKRYDELYPQYEKLSASLTAQFHAAERVRAGDGSPGSLMAESEVQRTVKEWEGLHRELEDIRGWFAA